MAPWQFNTKIIPRQGILLEHGEIPRRLEVVRISAEVPMIELEARSDSLPNYWAASPLLSCVEEKLGQLLPSRESWSDSAKMYGDSKADSIEIWVTNDKQVDRVVVAFSLSEPDLQFIRAAIKAVDQLDCLFLNIESREVFTPTLEQFVEQAVACNACRFLPDRSHFCSTLLGHNMDPP